MRQIRGKSLKISEKSPFGARSDSRGSGFMGERWRVGRFGGDFDMVGLNGGRGRGAPMIEVFPQLQRYDSSLMTKDIGA
jgi:hypothetical protein